MNEVYTNKSPVLKGYPDDLQDGEQLMHIKHFPDIYGITNYGRVWSFERFCTTIRHDKPIHMTRGKRWLGCNVSEGKTTVVLSVKDPKTIRTHLPVSSYSRGFYTVGIAQLVAWHFVEGAEYGIYKRLVRLDNDNTNNRADNLGFKSTSVKFRKDSSRERKVKPVAKDIELATVRNPRDGLFHARVVDNLGYSRFLGAFKSKEAAEKVKTAYNAGAAHEHS